MKPNIYLQLTNEFNADKARAVICSGQAAVLHRVAIMSKDGDWILREDAETCQQVLTALERHGAHYRFGAPLDIRWLAGGWSSHFEFTMDGLRVRTDFFSRPPRINAADLALLWQEQAPERPPLVNLTQLARMKQTDREKDYVVIGELARRMTDPADCLRFSRSAIDLLRLAEQHPDLVKLIVTERPLLAMIKAGRDRMEAALDAERREMIHANERRLDRFQRAADRWLAQWPAILQATQNLSLSEAHRIITEKAENLLPMSVP